MIYVLFLFSLLACSDDASARRTLEASGFSNIETTGFSFGCGESDALSTGFVATNHQGQRVEGVVCCGVVFKCCTVRF